MDRICDDGGGDLFLPLAANVLTGLLLILGFLALAITGLVLLHKGIVEFRASCYRLACMAL